MPKKGYKQTPEHAEARAAQMRGRIQSAEEKAFRVRNRRINQGEWSGGRPRNTADVLWSKVDKRGPDECWPWKGGIGAGGYGRTQIDGKSYYAHRVIYKLTHPREIAEEAPADRYAFGFVRHTCDNPICCNPAHLVLGTQQDNVNDKVARGRQNKWGGGIRSPRAKLTEEDVFFMRLQKKYGATKKALALLYDVSESTVSGCCYGRTYHDVPS